MATVRIYKVAELLNTSSQEVIALLKRDHGIEVKSASSTIEEVVARQFVERLARQRNIAVPSNASFADTPVAVKGRKPAGKAAEPAKPAAPSLPPPRLVKSAKPAAPPSEILAAPPAAAEAVLVPAPLPPPDVEPELPQPVAIEPVEVPEPVVVRSEEHTSELQSRLHLVCRLLLEKKNTRQTGEFRFAQALRFGDLLDSIVLSHCA